MTDLLRGNGTTTTGVHTEHHGLHVIVVSQLSQVFCRRLAHDAMATAIYQVRDLAVHDAAEGVVYGYLITVFVLISLHVQHVGEGQLGDNVVLAEFQAIFDLSLEFLGEQDLIDELRRQIVVGVGKCHDAVVGQLVQLFRRHLAALGNLLQPVLPDAVVVGGALLTVVVAHTRHRVALHITLIFAHLGGHILHANLVVESFQILALAAKTFEVDITLGIQVHLVGHRNHVIVGLQILVGVGHDPLAARLEILQGVAQLLGGGWSVELRQSAFQVDTLDIVVVLGLADAGNEVVKAHGTHVIHAEHGV